MQFLRTLFWVLVTAVVVVFAIQNWKQVDISLSGITVEIKLPLLLLLVFLIGFVPMLVISRTGQWQLRRRLDTAERALQQVAMSPPTEPTATAAEAEPRLLPSPLPVPPGAA
ncbi:putative integral membrane protein [Sphingomonas zeicaulis]|uniref:lipopolysaccharide assembly protein LapA domain-containing protein n=1 Tax=Sphingomonas zeicaulis TaxID=1632740 RepID=UPI003D22C217